MIRRYLVVVLVLLASRGVTAQESPDVWVRGIGVPQYFAVLVKDVDASVAWYCTALGLDELDGSEADDGAWRIMNLGNDHLAVEIIRDNRAQDVKRALGFFKVGFRVPDVEAVADRVAKATGERPHIVDFEAHSIRILQLKDPDGNTIQLFSPLEKRE